jgi:endonuclease/exonuclease/phosphatase family metal-dependent hydrolase
VARWARHPVWLGHLRFRPGTWLSLVAVLTAAPLVRAETPFRLRVLSWNVWGLPAFSTNLPERMAALPDAIAKLDPDVVLLQEIWAESDGARVRDGLARHGYSHATHLAHTEHGMTGLFTASKLPLKHVGFHPFASGRIGHSIWHLEWIASKGVGSFLLQTPLGELAVQNTHLQAQYETDVYAAERLSQVSEIVQLNRKSSLPLVLGGDFNTGSEDLPRQALLDLVALSDAMPSPRPDTIFVRGNQTTAIRVVGSREISEPVRLQNGVTTELSDHPAVLVDLELSSCAPCVSAPVASSGLHGRTHAELVAAAAITPSRMTLSLFAAACVLAAAISLYRRTPAGQHSPKRKALRLAIFTLLATTFVWTAYLGGLYYPSRAKALRFVAAGFATIPPHSK